jgi:Fic family protein
MKLSDRPCFEEYKSQIEERIAGQLANFHKHDLDLGYNLKASSVYSSNIEGNSLNLNSYMNLKLQSEISKNKEVKEIDDLVFAYEYAKSNSLSETAFLESHRVLSKTILIKSKQGKYRQERIGVFSDRGLVYLALEEEYVVQEMQLFSEEIQALLVSNLTLTEIFYFASLIHLRFVHIHPFSDGNGRAGRILEKWFLSGKIGSQMWGLPSEKYYRTHQSDYYDYLNLGVNFYVLDYARALNFLLMLPKSFEESF